MSGTITLHVAPAKAWLARPGAPGTGQRRLEGERGGQKGEPGRWHPSDRSWHHGTHHRCLALSHPFRLANSVSPSQLTNPITPLTFWSRSHTDTNHRDRRQRTCTTGATQCRTHTALNSWADVQPFNNIQLWTRQWPEATYQHTALDCSTAHTTARHHLYGTSIKWGGDRYCTTCVIGNLGLISVAAIEERLLFSTFRRTGEALTPPPGHGISGQIALRTPIGTGQNWSTHTNNSHLALTSLRLKRHHGRIQAAPKTQQHLPSGVAATVTRK